MAHLILKYPAFLSLTIYLSNNIPRSITYIITLAYWLKLNIIFVKSIDFISVYMFITHHSKIYLLQQVQSVSNKIKLVTMSGLNDDYKGDEYRVHNLSLLWSVPKY